MIAIISIIESMKRGRPELVARAGWPVLAVVRGLCLWGVDAA